MTPRALPAAPLLVCAAGKAFPAAVRPLNSIVRRRMQPVQRRMFLASTIVLAVLVLGGHGVALARSSECRSAFIEDVNSRRFEELTSDDVSGALDPRRVRSQAFPFVVHVELAVLSDADHFHVLYLAMPWGVFEVSRGLVQRA